MDPTASEVNGQVAQEPNAGQAAGADQGLQPGASETESQATQEPQAQPTTFTPEQVEQMRREWQSQKDREVHQARMALLQQQEQLRQQEAERARLENMDDEEYGSYVRQQQQAQMQQQEIIRQQLIAIQQETLNAIADKTVREAVEAKINSGQYHSWAEMTQDIVDQLADRKASAAAKKAAADAAAAAQRDSAAQMADTPIPTLGTGSASSRSLAGLSSEQLLEQGIAEAMAAKRKRGG